MASPVRFFKTAEPRRKPGLHYVQPRQVGISLRSTENAGCLLYEHKRSLQLRLSADGAAGVKPDEAALGDYFAGIVLTGAPRGFIVCFC